MSFRNALAALLAVVLLSPAAAVAESDSSRLNQARKEIGRALVEVQSGNWPSVLAYYAEDIEYHDPIVTINGIDEMAAFLGALFGNSPDLITTVEHEICINDTYTATWTMEGFFGPFPYVAEGMSVIRFRPKETVAYYQRDYYSEGDIMAGIPELDVVIGGFRHFYRCAVDPAYVPPEGLSCEPPPAEDG